MVYLPPELFFGVPAEYIQEMMAKGYIISAPESTDCLICTEDVNEGDSMCMILNDLGSYAHVNCVFKRVVEETNE